MKAAHYIFMIIIFLCIQMLNTITRLDFTSLLLSFAVVYLIHLEYDSKQTDKDE